MCILLTEAYTVLIIPSASESESDTPEEVPVVKMDAYGKLSLKVPRKVQPPKLIQHKCKHFSHTNFGIYFLHILF